MSTRRQMAFWLPAACMGFAVLINVAQFPGIECDARHNYRALYPYDSGDVFEIAISHDNSSRRWVGPFHYVGKLYPGSEIVIPRKGVKTWFDFDLAMRGFGKTGSFISADYDPVNFLEGIDLNGYEVPPSAYAPSRGTTQEELAKRFSFFAGPKPSGRLIVITPDGSPGRTGRIHFVDTGILPKDLVEKLVIE